jgi:hypothetical protein
MVGLAGIPAIIFFISSPAHPKRRLRSLHKVSESAGPYETPEAKTLKEKISTPIVVTAVVIVLALVGFFRWRYVSTPAAATSSGTSADKQEKMKQMQQEMMNKRNQQMQRTRGTGSGYPGMGGPGMGGPGMGGPGMSGSSPGGPPGPPQGP